MDMSGNVMRHKYRCQIGLELLPRLAQPRPDPDFSIASRPARPLAWQVRLVG